MNRPRVALVNCKVLPEPDPDERPLVAAFSALGADAGPAAWDDPAVDWGSFDACVMRAAWNYYRAPDAFADWVAAAGRRTSLVNSPAAIAWNLDKRYLNELQACGVPVVDTVWVDDSPCDVRLHCHRGGWDAIVIKPTISAASFQTQMFTRDQCADAQAFLDANRAERSMMLQPYLDSVETLGEISAAWIDGALSHAWRKHVRLAGQAERVVPGAALARTQTRLVEEAIDACPYPLVFARVDLMQDADHRWCVSELEVIEPSLYFDFQPGSAHRLAAAVLRRCA